MTKCYVGICKCGNLVAAVVADTDFISDPEKKAAYQKYVATDVAEFIREGLSIEQREVEEVRTQFSACTCPKPAKTDPNAPRLPNF